MHDNNFPTDTGLDIYHHIVYAECGRYTFYINTMCKILRHWLRVLGMHENRIPLKVYKMQLYYSNCDYTTFASYIRTILFSYEFGYVWMFQSVEDISSFITAFKMLLLCFGFAEV